MQIEIELTLTAQCSECGGAVEGEVSKMRNGDYVVTVDPCERCIEEASRTGKEA